MVFECIRDCIICAEARKLIMGMINCTNLDTTNILYGRVIIFLKKIKLLSINQFFLVDKGFESD